MSDGITYDWKKDIYEPLVKACKEYEEELAVGITKERAQRMMECLIYQYTEAVVYKDFRDEIERIIQAIKC